MLKLAKLFFATAVTAFGLALFAGPASAEDTVWLCKPGEADNPCLGKMDGIALLPDSTVELGYEAASDAPVDCFYLYPTQSDQGTANANLDKDQPIRDVAVNQARQFSRVCDVYAPMYRQYTFQAPVTDEVRDVAYNSALGAWRDYMENYNDGRGVVIIAHSQGSMNMARLIAEEVDPKPSVRKRLISAILPGANVYVPKDEVVGGQFQNIPACEAGDQLGCVIAYSMFLNQPGTGSSYGWIDTGYWINPAPRPDKDLFEVLCVNPGDLTGEAGMLRPLANLDVFLGGEEGEKPWLALPDYYTGECRSAVDEPKGEVNWLNVEKTAAPGDARPDLASLVNGGGGNLHLGDINLALDSLVAVAGSQSRAYISSQRAAAVKKRSAVRRQLKSAKKKSKKLSKQARKAKKLCASKGKRCAKAKKLGKKSKKAQTASLVVEEA